MPAPSIDAYYEFCGGGKPGSGPPPPPPPPKTPPPPPPKTGGDELGDLLDAEDGIDFNPNEFHKEIKMDINLDEDGPPKDPNAFDPNADLSKMTLPE